MIDEQFINSLYESLNEDSRHYLDIAIEKIVETKKKGGKVVVVTGSGPNIHEGVTTLIAEFINKGLVDGVTTSSAVVSHEMGGVLDKVKRISIHEIGEEFLDFEKMPRGDVFELTELNDKQWDALRKEMIIDEALAERCKEKDGTVIIKAAGNMAYPIGYRNEDIASEICEIARTCHVPFETVAGWGCDERSMLGAGARKDVPVLVSVPQLIGGGQIGINIADSISVAERCYRISQMLSDADVIIESAVALTQEIHDGPFETYTGHGIWAAWKGYKTYSLKDKTLIRFDLDENLKKAWDLDKNSGDVQAAIDKGLPKTKMSKIPFRMEMSAFSRLEKSIPVIGDIGVLWSILALKVSQALNIKLDFISYPQQTPNGKEMREWIVNNIDYIKLEKIKAWLSK
jgi:hypothetical protein